MNNICPVCQKDDVIQRVQVAVQAGQSSGAFSGPSGGVTYSNGRSGTFTGYSSLSGSTSTDLARLLAPPPEPRKTGLGFIFWFSAIVTGLWFAVTLPNMLISLVGLFQGLLNGNANNIFLAFVWGGIPFIGCVLPLSVMTTLIFISQNRKRIQADIRYASEKPAWDRAMQKWFRLYFCFRDGIVFDPENSKTCEPSQLREFLFR